MIPGQFSTVTPLFRPAVERCSIVLQASPRFSSTASTGWSPSTWRFRWLFPRPSRSLRFDWDCHQKTNLQWAACRASLHLGLSLHRGLESPYCAALAVVCIGGTPSVTSNSRFAHCKPYHVCKTLLALIHATFSHSASALPLASTLQLSISSSSPRLARDTTCSTYGTHVARVLAPESGSARPDFHDTYHACTGSLILPLPGAYGHCEPPGPTLARAGFWRSHCPSSTRSQMI